MKKTKQTAKDIQIEQDVGGLLTDPLDVQIMVHMCQGKSTPDVSRMFNVSQGLVRHRTLRSLTKLHSLSGYAETFERVKQRLQADLDRLTHTEDKP